MFLVSLHAMRFPSAVLGRVDSSSSETTLPLGSLLFRAFLTTFEVDDLCEELGRNCVAARDPPVRCLIEFKRILRCCQINRKQAVMMVLHVEGRGCTSGRVSDEMAKRMRSTLFFFCRCLFRNLLAEVRHPDLYCIFIS